MNARRRLATIAIFFAALVVASLFWAHPAEAQCALCRTALTESPEGQKMAEGFNAAILFLLGAPYLVFGSLAASLWVLRKRNRPPSPPTA